MKTTTHPADAIITGPADEHLGDAGRIGFSYCIPSSHPAGGEYKTRAAARSTYTRTMARRGSAAAV